MEEEKNQDPQADLSKKIAEKWAFVNTSTTEGMLSMNPSKSKLFLRIIAENPIEKWINSSKQE